MGPDFSREHPRHVLSDEGGRPAHEPGSSIINTASINSDTPNPTLLAYATTKGAIQNFTAGLAQLLADKGIRANAVAPGPIWTVYGHTSRVGVWRGGDGYHGCGGNRNAGAQRVSLRRCCLMRAPRKRAIDLAMIRYFPEVAAMLAGVSAPQFVVDGELVIEIDGQQSFMRSRCVFILPKRESKSFREKRPPASSFSISICE
jgi:NAD(P)-dependent dehydrogenase (short-subunit alcohol dehydrogenase family)